MPLILRFLQYQFFHEEKVIFLTNLKNKIMIMKHCIRSTWERINTSKVNLFLTTEKSQKVLKIFKQLNYELHSEGANFYLEVSRLNRLK